MHQHFIYNHQPPPPTTIKNRNRVSDVRYEMTIYVRYSFEYSVGKGLGFWYHYLIIWPHSGSLRIHYFQLSGANGWCVHRLPLLMVREWCGVYTRLSVFSAICRMISLTNGSSSCNSTHRRRDWDRTRRHTGFSVCGARRMGLMNIFTKPFWQKSAPKTYIAWEVTTPDDGLHI